MAGGAVALIALVLLVFSGPGHRMEIIDVRTAINLVKWSGMTAMAGIGFCLIGAFLAFPGKGKRGFGVSVVGLLVSTLLVANLLLLKHKAESVPPIHDITTDYEDPPVFKAMLPFRAEAPNTADYGGPEIAAQQVEAYPDIVPLELTVTPEAAFAKVKAEARALGWKIVSEEGGILEATDTTAWLGFKDDVVVRVTPRPQGSRVDARSLSRIGQSDLGKNAERIRALFARLKSGR